MAYTRRGSRIPVHIPVRVTSLDATNWFCESGLVILANQHGCAVRIPRSVGFNTPVLLESLSGNKMTSARAVNCHWLPEREGFWLVGLELHEPGNVWGVETSPNDWHCPERGVSWIGRVLSVLHSFTSKQKSDPVLHTRCHFRSYSAFAMVTLA